MPEEIAQYQGIYVRYYQAFDGDSFHTLTPHSLYDRQEPVCRLMQNIQNNPRSISMGKAFLLLEYVRDHLFLSADVEQPFLFSQKGPLGVIQAEGFPEVYIRYVPIDEPGRTSTNDQRVYDFLNDLCHTLITAAHQTPPDTYQYIPKKDQHRYHPSFPTLQTLRALLKYVSKHGHYISLPKGTKNDLLHWRTQAAQEDFTRLAQA